MDTSIESVSLEISPIMSSLFESDEPQPPAEDPSIAAERQRQQQLADQERVRSIQENLRGQTEANLGSVFGLRSLAGPFSFSPFGARSRNSPIASPRAGRRSLLGSG